VANQLPLVRKIPLVTLKSEDLFNPYPLFFFGNQILALLQLEMTFLVLVAEEPETLSPARQAPLGKAQLLIIGHLIYPHLKQ
jgi:hypothetical protein